MSAVGTDRRDSNVDGRSWEETIRAGMALRAALGPIVGLFVVDDVPLATIAGLLVGFLQGTLFAEIRGRGSR